jgi:hypothetical protein
MSAALAAPAVVIAAAPQIRRIIVGLRAHPGRIRPRSGEKRPIPSLFFFAKIYGELLFNR